MWQPKYEWGDIPILLDLAQSRRPAGQIPALLISSYHQRECSEGMIALWLIEGLRARYHESGPEKAGGRWHYRLPLNPMCMREDASLTDCENSREIHDTVLARYRRWWSVVKDMDPEQAAGYNPLAGERIRWFGGRSTGQALGE